jgi:8-oxo-dGTP pyrophosphatase MutT (NUDIX family)
VGYSVAISKIFLTAIPIPAHEAPTRKYFDFGILSPQTCRENHMLRILYLAYQAYIFIFRPVTYGVRVLLVKEGRVLLIRHTYRSGWHMPGGGIQRGETVETAARREVREETGAEMGQIKLAGIFSNLESRSSGHNILFSCEDFIITGKPDHEIAEARFFSLSKLPADMFPGHRRKIEEYLETGSHRSADYGRW